VDNKQIIPHEWQTTATNIAYLASVLCTFAQTRLLRTTDTLRTLSQPWYREVWELAFEPDMQIKNNFLEFFRFIFLWELNKIQKDMSIMEKTISGVIIECIKGDIASQADITAIVNAANAQLRIGGGVAGAIYRAAGPGLEEECLPLAPIKPGEAVITGGHNLPNRYVIHCLGPIFGVDKPEDKLLTNCYRNALNLAEKYKIDSIAFPAISTGAFGYPVEEATEVAFRTIIEIVPKLRYVKRIRFVLYSDRDLNVHEKTLSLLISQK